MIETIEKIRDVEISSLKKFATKIPTKVIIQSEIVLLDCPGFSNIEREPIQDIANAFYV